MNEDGLKLVWRVEDPIGLGRQPEQFLMFVLIIFVPELESVAGLGQAVGAGTANFNARSSDQRWRIGQRTDSVHRLEHGNMSESLPRIGGRAFAQTVND